MIIKRKKSLFYDNVPFVVKEEEKNDNKSI